MSAHWIALDWDHTLWDTPKHQPMSDADYILDRLHMRGWKVIVHSCNNPAIIRGLCTEHNLRVDAIWGEDPMDKGQKPVASIYVDDRGFYFDGNWRDSIDRIIEQVIDRERNPKNAKK